MRGELVLNQFCRFLMKMDTTNWEAPDVIARQCSAGTILRGVLHTMDKDVYKITPRQLVKVPNKLELLEPLIGVKDHEHASCIIKQRAKLHNKHQLDAFEQSFLKSEISLDAEFNIKGLSNWAGNCKKRQEKADNQAKKTKKETKFYSEASYTMLAVARMHVEKEIKLELSDDASDALYYIHQQDIATKKWKKNNKRRHLYNLCSDFFRDFGTHFNYGVFHLGGIIITSVTFEGDTESSMDTIKKAVSASLDACENVGFSETVSAKWLKEHVNTSGNFEERDFKNIRVVCQQYGGFPITKTFTENDWMEDLRKESVNWVVINRGYSKDVGVWELLPEDGFDDRKLFLYENLFKFHSTYLYRDQMYRIMATGTGPESILNALRDMTDKTETREKTDGVTKEWLHLLLDDRNVAKFLLTTERYSQDLATKDLDVIEQILDQLLGYVGGNDFEDKGKVYQLKENIKNMSLRR